MVNLNKISKANEQQMPYQVFCSNKLYENLPHTNVGSDSFIC